MGMLETHMKLVPDGITLPDYLATVGVRVAERAAGDFGEARAEGHEVRAVTATSFDEDWSQQENLKQTDEVREKYRRLAGEGKVIYVEIDW